MVNFPDKYKFTSCTNEIAHVNVKVYILIDYIYLYILPK